MNSEKHANMYRLVGRKKHGNLSLLLDEEVVSKYLDLNKVIRNIPFSFDGKDLQVVFLWLPVRVNISEMLQMIRKETPVLFVFPERYLCRTLGYNDGGK